MDGLWLLRHGPLAHERISRTQREPKGYLRPQFRQKDRPQRRSDQSRHQQRHHEIIINHSYYEL